MWLPQVGTWRRIGVTSRAVTEECYSIAQVDWTLRWINRVLMKQKHVKITPRSIQCFNTCGFLCRNSLHLYISLCCVTWAEGRPEELGYHNITVKYYILFLMTAKHRITITKRSQWWLVWNCFRHWVCIISVCGLVLFCFINCSLIFVPLPKYHCD